MPATRRITKRVRLAQKRRKLYLIFFLLSCGLVVLAYAGLSLLLVQENIKVNTININNNRDVDAEDLRVTVMYGLAAVNSMILFEGTIFTYDKKSIRETLLFTYPRLESVELKASKLGTIDLNVSERAAVAQWCDEGCYLVDNSGFVFEPIDQVQERLVTYKGDISGDVLRRSLLRGDFARVHSIVGLLSDIGVSVDTIELYDDEANIINKDHPVFKIKLDHNLSRTLSYIRVTLDSKEYKDKLDSEEGVEYIDLRFDNRVYYK